MFLPLLALVAVAPALAQAPDTEATPSDGALQAEPPVIPAGMEPLFADMLGSGASLPAGCKFTDGKIERTTVLATYACQDGEVVLELVHPDGAPPGGVRTENFALSVKSGTAPQGLTDAIAERIRAREGAFSWKTFGEETSTAKRKWLAIAAAVLVAVVLIWATRRSRSKRQTPAA
jgi:hypothetical protein